MEIGIDQGYTISPKLFTTLIQYMLKYTNSNNMELLEQKYYSFNMHK